MLANAETNSHATGQSVIEHAKRELQTAGVDLPTDIEKDSHLLFVTGNNMVTYERLARELSLNLDALRPLLVKISLSNASEVIKWENLAGIDSLTGAFNRRKLDSFITEVHTSLVFGSSDKRRKRHAIVMMDVDNFKRFNNDFGHAVGDSVLKELVRVVRAKLRDNDNVGRYGGEEFCCVISGDDNERWEEVVISRFETIRTKITQEISDIVWQQTEKKVDVTASFGIFFPLTPAKGVDLEDCINYYYRNADKLLLRAKNNGKNRIVSFRE